MIEFKIKEQLPSLNDYINKLKSPNGKVMGARFKREVDNLCMSYIQPYRMKIAAYCKEPVNIIDVKDWYATDANGKPLHTLRNNLFLCTIGVDFGGNKSSTAFTLTGYTKGYKECVTLKERRIKQEITPVQLEKMFCDFVKECIRDYPNTYTAYCDSAEQVLIRGLRKAVINERLPIDVKNARKGEIIDRIRFGITMFAQRRFFILSDCKETIQAYTDAVWQEDKEDVRLDDGTTNIDNIDSSEYSQEPFMKTMIDLTAKRG